MKYGFFFVLFLANSLFSQTANTPAKDKRIFTKPFIAVHSAFLGSVIYDAEMTHEGLAHHRCTEDSWENPYPSRGDLYKKDLIFFAGITAMDIAFQALHIKFAPYAGAGVGIFKHIHGGTRWARDCW